MWTSDTALNLWSEHGMCIGGVYSHCRLCCVDPALVQEGRCHVFEVHCGHSVLLDLWK